MARNLAPTFYQDERGGVAIIFALIFTILAMFMGLAVDYSRMLSARSALSAAADAAALAAGRAMLISSTTPAQAEAIGQAYFAENAKGVLRAGAPIPTPVISPDPAGKSVTVSASGVVPMTFAVIAGVNNVTIPVTSTISFDAKDLEVGMAIDVTGSMGDTVDGVRKIDALKTAFQRFAVALIPDNQTLGRRVRLGVAPYSTSINLGPAYAAVASNNQSTNGCVVERTSATFTDARPTIGGYFSVIGGGCPPAIAMALTDNKTALINRVNSFGIGGGTGGHFGVQWAWNLISEDYAGFWGVASAPDAYAKTLGEKPELVKAMIIMTDGEFNTSYRHGASANQALSLCTAAKARGVIVMTIGFGLNNSPASLAAKTMLQNCASPPKKPGDPLNFVDAASPTQLDAALQGFAASLSQLRIAG
jgi:Flp pilus assembly protein TadG